MNLMCERAGMFEDRIYDRTKAVFKNFGLPFDGDAGGQMTTAKAISNVRKLFNNDDS